MRLTAIAIGLLLQLFTYTSSLFGYEISICAIFQNEAPYLKEWIEYHRLVGVEHFWLYNNNSTDNYKKVLEPYVRLGIVNVINWPSPPHKDWTPYQAKVYNHCIKKVKRRTKWLAIIDTDEFIVPVQHNNLKELLTNYEELAGLQIFWQFFGTSYIYEIPKTQTLIESLLMKAPKDSEVNYNFKTIVRPDRVSKFYVHGGDYIHPFFALFPHNTRGGARQPIHIDIVRIHHYWTRDEKYFRKNKVKRRQRCEGSTYTEEHIQSILNGLNQEVDDTIIRFVPALRKRLGL